MEKKNKNSYAKEHQKIINDISISLKYYGINDLSTGHDIKYIVDKYKFVSNIFQGKKLTNIKDISDLYLYFLAKKLIRLEETIPYIIGDDNKNLVQKAANICKTYVEDIYQEEIIRYINNEYRVICTKSHYKNDFLDVVFDFIFEYNSGINERVWMYLAENFNYVLINNYDRIKQIFRKEYGKNILDKVIDVKSSENFVAYDLKSVLSILDNILQFKNEKIVKVANEKLDAILKIVYTDKKEDVEKYGDRYLIIKSHLLYQVVEFLRKRGDGRTNKFIKKMKEINRREDEILKHEGKGIVYEIPIGERLKQWREIKIWTIKLLYLSNDLNIEDGHLVNITSWIEKADIEDSLLDHISYNIPTDDYFTYVRQLTLQVILSIGAGVMNVILKNDKDLLEYCKLISSALFYIKDHSSSIKARILIYDTGLLVEGIRNLSKENSPKSIDYYGLSVLICALLEKILKILIEDIVKDDHFVSTDQLTLGKILRVYEGNELVDVFGADHLKHLSFYLVTYGDKRIGYEKRNKVAHLSEDIEEFLDEHFISELLWLFTDVLNTILWKYIQDSSMIDK